MARKPIENGVNRPLTHFAPISMRDRRFAYEADAEKFEWVRLTDQDTQASVLFDADGRVRAGLQANCGPQPRATLDVDDAGRLMRQELGVSLSELVSALLGICFDLQRQLQGDAPIVSTVSAQSTPAPIIQKVSEQFAAPVSSGFVVGTRVAVLLGKDHADRYFAAQWHTGLIQSDALNSHGQVGVLYDMRPYDADGNEMADSGWHQPSALRVLDVQFPHVREKQDMICGGRRCPGWHSERHARRTDFASDRPEARAYQTLAETWPPQELDGREAV